MISNIASIDRRGVKAVLLASTLTAIVVAAIMLSVSLFSSDAYAGGLNIKDLSKKSYSTVLMKGKENNTLLFYSDGDRAISKAKSSNKKVATVAVERQKPINTEFEHFEGYYCLKLTLKKTGTTKISYVYKGKKYSTTLKVNKYTNPFKTLTINGKSYKSGFDYKKASRSELNDFYSVFSDLNFKGKVKVKAAKNWKLEKIYSGYMENGKKMKNGGSIDNLQCTVKLKNTKTGATHCAILFCSF